MASVPRFTKRTLIVIIYDTYDTYDTYDIYDTYDTNFSRGEAATAYQQSAWKAQMLKFRRDSRLRFSR